jgi:hypothetical protein
MTILSICAVGWCATCACAALQAQEKPPCPTVPDLPLFPEQVVAQKWSTDHDPLQTDVEIVRMLPGKTFETVLVGQFRTFGDGVTRYDVVEPRPGSYQVSATELKSLPRTEIYRRGDAIVVGPADSGFKRCELDDCTAPKLAQSLGTGREAEQRIRLVQWVAHLGDPRRLVAIDGYTHLTAGWGDSTNASLISIPLTGETLKSIGGSVQAATAYVRLTATRDGVQSASIDIHSIDNKADESKPWYIDTRISFSVFEPISDDDALPAAIAALLVGPGESQHATGEPTSDVAKNAVTKWSAGTDALACDFEVWTLDPEAGDEVLARGEFRFLKDGTTRVEAVWVPADEDGQPPPPRTPVVYYVNGDAVVLMKDEKTLLRLTVADCRDELKRTSDSTRTSMSLMPYSAKLRAAVDEHLDAADAIKASLFLADPRRLLASGLDGTLESKPGSADPRGAAVVVGHFTPKCAAALGDVPAVRAAELRIALDKAGVVQTATLMMRSEGSEVSKPDAPGYWDERAVFSRFRASPQEEVPPAVKQMLEASGEKK